MEYRELNWQSIFDPAYGVVTLPGNFVFFRGHMRKYQLSHRPAYFGAREVAHSYAVEPDTELSTFTNMAPLKLLDIRFMQDILRRLFALHNDMKDRESTLCVLLSFGICSLYHQARLAQQRYKGQKLDGLDALKKAAQESANSNFEEPGVRVAETTNDAESMAFLRALFAGFVDGFISPATHTVFHTEKQGILHAEMIQEIRSVMGQGAKRRNGIASDA
jgi:hypothetical protein